MKAHIMCGRISSRKVIEVTLSKVCKRDGVQQAVMSG
jgi:hypothetical protein